MISVYFRDAVENWEDKNVSFAPEIFSKDVQLQFIKAGCNFLVFGGPSIGKGIENFLSNKSVKEYSFDCRGDGRYFYIIRREKD